MLKKYSASLLLLLCCSCSSLLKNKIDFDPTEPLRVAVLPFAQIDSEGKFLADNADVFLVDHILGLSKASKKSPARIVQEITTQELALSNLEILPGRLVEGLLLHDGYSKGEHLDVEKLHHTSASVVCKILACDAVLYGTISEWDRSYYGIQSVNSIAFKLKLVRANDGKTIFSSKVEDSESHGLSQGPTGYASLILEPIKGLDSEAIEQLASKNVKAAVAPLVSKSVASEMEMAPYLVSGAHSVSMQMLSRTEPLTVMAFGSPKNSAYFSIGNYIKNIPMKEVSPGHYLGLYLPLVEDKFNDQEIKVVLIDKSNRRISLKIKPGPVSLD